MLWALGCLDAADFGVREDGKGLTVEWAHTAHEEPALWAFGRNLDNEVPDSQRLVAALKGEDALVAAALPAHRHNKHAA